jgi:hypothetical protein
MGFRRYGTAPDQQVTETETRGEQESTPDVLNRVLASGNSLKDPQTSPWSDLDAAELAQESES